MFFYSCYSTMKDILVVSYKVDTSKKGQVIVLAPLTITLIFEQKKKKEKRTIA